MVNKVVKLEQAAKDQEACAFKHESGSDMKYKISKILMFSIGTLFALVIARKVYRYMRFDIPITMSRPNEPSMADFDYVDSFPVILNENDQAITYDFKSLVDLFVQCDRIKRQFYRDFTPHFARKKEVDLEKVEEILKKLYQERARFGQYAWELKGHAQQGLSLKKRRSLVYYQSVIQKNIEVLERIKKVSQP